MPWISGRPVGPAGAIIYIAAKNLGLGYLRAVGVSRLPNKMEGWRVLGVCAGWEKTQSAHVLERRWVVGEVRSLGRGGSYGSQRSLLGL